MPKIIWPEQATRLRDACARHGTPLPAGVTALLAPDTPPPMSPAVARCFLRCFYAARDVERAERDLRDGGPQTDAFAARAMARRVTELRRHVTALEDELVRCG